jgi:hypothetical protein
MCLKTYWSYCIPSCHLWLKNYGRYWYITADYYFNKSITPLISIISRILLLFLFQAFPYRKQALMVTPWPTTGLPKDLRSIKRFQNLQSLVKLCTLVLQSHLRDATVHGSHFIWLPMRWQIRGIRNVRAEYSVEPAKRISASVVATADVLEYVSVSLHVHFVWQLIAWSFWWCDFSRSLKQTYILIALGSSQNVFSQYTYFVIYL